MREKHWMVAVGAAAIVLVVDLFVLTLILFKHRRERSAAEMASGPTLRG
jgi:hypothetical protein